MSVWVYAGAAQFAALEGIKQDLFWVSIVLTMLLINLRHIPMSLARERIFNRFGLGERLFLAHGLTDEAFALDITSKPRSHFYYFGIHTLCWLSWISGTWGAIAASIVVVVASIVKLPFLLRIALGCLVFGAIASL